ncbi:uncharacterized protein LOC125572279 [Nematostella vectensis]|uniref:uncharacterized protein LOC125572279 n=1 Tax=Nematostella vectensis TaxID=45351 RepID=UPI002076E7A4|nr:uncharacterized protein LOC125572279 [Nematostella vectensis]XP_048588586.1 uncharacterized protein LOC125572279 [Nematostella vectensis]
MSYKMKFTEFVKRYPYYSRFRFSADEHGNVQFVFNGDEYDPFDKNGNLVKTLYHFPGNSWKPENIQDFLVADDTQAYKETIQQLFGFPKQYRLDARAEYKILPWDENPTRNNYVSFDVFITPELKTHFVFRDIFTDSELVFRTAKEASRWLDAPNLSYWSQALNFAMFCATAGCGVTRDMIDDSQVGSFYRFHIIFTIRRLLNELQCPLPKDKLFSWNKNFYSEAAYQKLRTEFRTDSDFRFLGPINHGLGNVYNYDYHGLSSSNDKYKPYGTIDQLHDEWDAAKSDDEHMNHFEIEYLKDPRTEFQYEWFFPEKSMGLTKAGLSRINQSIEAFVYCILGAQVQTRSSIVGDSGSAQETKQVFSKLFESAVIENDISKSIQRYQFALQQARQKLDLAFALGCWLSPSYLVINDDTSIAGYNNKLQKATTDMKLGLNPINNEIKTIPKHNMGHSKILLPHTESVTAHKPKPEAKTNPKPDVTKPLNTQHENNLVMITVFTAGLAWYLFR